MIAINPTHAQIRFPCGREASVSLRHLAPLPSVPSSESNITTNIPGSAIIDEDSVGRGLPTPVQSFPGTTPPDSTPSPSEIPTPGPAIQTSTETVAPRRSSRATMGIPPSRYEAG